jgi:amidohydrolase
MAPCTEPRAAGLTELLECLTCHEAAAVDLRHELHALAELGHDEQATAARIRAALGAGAEPGPGTAIVGDLGRAGRRVAVRAELDALPVVERTGVPWANENGRMHACGHDVHMAATAALWWAARELGERLPLRLRVLFQPSEERYPSGAKLLVDHGLLESVDAVVAAHVHPELPAGEVALDSGPVNAACANFSVVVDGRGGHVAYPERALDPVPALAAVLGAIGRLGCESDDGLVAVGVVACGESENVIPSRAEVRGTVRARSDKARTALLVELERIVRSQAAAHGCGAAVDIEEGEPALINDASIASEGRRLLEEVGLSLAEPWRSYGADDFAFYGAAAPCAMAFVGLEGMAGFVGRPLHHPEFLPPDAAVGRVATGLACLVYAAAGAAS